MRDAEGFMQIHVHDVGADMAGFADADEGLQVGAIHIDEATGVVHDGTDVANTFLEHTVGRRVGDHQGGKVVGMFGCLGSQVIERDVAVIAAFNDDDAHVGHHRRCRVGAVGGRRNQADVSVVVATAVVIVANGQQARILSLRPRIGL